MDSSIQSKCAVSKSEEASYSNSSADEEAKEGERTEEEDQVSREEEEPLAKEVEEEASQSGGDTLTNTSGLTLLKDRKGVERAVAEDGEATPPPSDKFANFLQSEFELLEGLCQPLAVEKADWSKRRCKVRASFATRRQPRHFFCVSANFPSGYPERSPPTFALSKGSTLDGTQRKRMMRALKQEARERAKEGRPSLARCLERLRVEVEAIQTEEDYDQEEEGPVFPLAGADPRNVLEGGSVLFGDVNVPYPRTSGATFCGDGRIICFGGPLRRRRPSSSAEATPRTLAIFNAQQQQQQTSSPLATITSPPGGSSSSSLIKEEVKALQQHQQQDLSSLKRKGRFNIRRVTSSSASDLGSVVASLASPGRPPRTTSLSSAIQRKVTVYAAARLFPYDRRLARSYVLRRSDPCEVCLENAQVATKLEMRERAHLWQVCSRVGDLLDGIRPGERDEEVWLHHPHGRALLSRVMRHLLANQDLQMAALLACVFLPAEPIPTQPQLPVIRLASSPPRRPPLLLSPQRKTSLSITSKRKSKRRSILHRPPPPSPSDSRTATPPTPPPSTEKKQKFWFLGGGGGLQEEEEEAGHNPYHTVHSGAAVFAQKKKRQLKMERKSLAQVSTTALGSEGNLEQFVTPYYKASRSNSWTAEEAIDESEAVLSPAISEETEGLERSTAAATFTVLNAEDSKSHESLKLAYAEVLTRWGMLLERTWFLKFSRGGGSESHAFRQSFSAACADCGAASLRSPRCHRCRGASLRCAVCRLPVRGMARACAAGCGHGGHFAHWTKWFRSSRAVCPAPGCDCRCAAGNEAVMV